MLNIYISIDTRMRRNAIQMIFEKCQRENIVAMTSKMLCTPACRAVGPIYAN